MFAISSIGNKLLEKLKKPAFRHAYLAEHVRHGIAYQIRALRDQREWKQGKFSKLLGKPQSVICRLEDPSYGKFTVQTLLEVANVFDVALELRFVPYSSFLQRTRDVSATSMHVFEFKDDLGMTSASTLHHAIVVKGQTVQNHPIQFGWPIAAPTNVEISTAYLPTATPTSGGRVYVH